MKIALTIFPTFSDKSIPLGLACINGALREAGHGVQVYDFDYLLSVEDPDLYWKVHGYAWGSDARVVNYLGGTDLELILRTVFSEDEWLENLEKRDANLFANINKIHSFVATASRRILADAPEQVWFSTYVSNLWLSMLAARAIRDIDPSISVGFGGPAVHAAEGGGLFALWYSAMKYGGGSGSPSPDGGGGGGFHVQVPFPLGMLINR